MAEQRSSGFQSARSRLTAFCQRFGLQVPILQAPMAGSCPPGLAAAVANAGGMGGMGALMTSPEGIAEWVAGFRSQSNGPFQLNRWIPQSTPARNPASEKRMRDFLAKWGPPVPAEVGDVRFPDFEQQCEAFLAAAPFVVSSIMGLFPAAFVRRLKDRGIAWFACVTTLAEALEAERAGADAAVAQGHEAGGHRGSFDQAAADSTRKAAILAKPTNRRLLPGRVAHGITPSFLYSFASTLDIMREIVALLTRSSRAASA